MLDMFIGNEFTKIVHSPYCEWVDKIGSENWVMFEMLADALLQEYTECKCCLGEPSEFWKRKEQRDRDIERINSKFFGECICCGETRGIQRAHIIPKLSSPDGRVMPLCPRCHWNYDHDLLDGPEWATIDHWIKRHVQDVCEMRS